MSDQILKFLVWQGLRLYLRRRFARFKHKAIVVGLAAAVVAGVIAVQRQTSSSS